MRIYTKTGDNGKSDTISDEDLSKDSCVFDVLGTIDELSAYLGVAKSEADKELQSILGRLQTQLIGVAAYAAGGDKVDFNLFTLENEKLIDEFSAKINLPDTIIHCGKTLIGARIDVSRTIARRLERVVVASKKLGESLAYFNRLSDLLFVLARVADER